MRTLRIALVAPGIPSAATGPAFWIKELSSGLCDAGYDLTVVVGDAPVHGAGARVEIDARARLVLFPARSQLRWRLHYNLSLNRWLRDNIAKVDIVDIQGVWSFVSAHAARTCISADVPYVLTPHGQMAAWDWQKKYWRKRAFFELVGREIWRSADAIHFVSHGERQRLQRGCEEVGHVIPYWIRPASDLDTTRKAIIRSQLDIPREAPLLIFLGRVCAQKGVVEIVLAFDRLRRRYPAPFLLIVGPQDPNYTAQLLQVVDSIASKTNIRMLGAVYDQRKLELLSAASLFITLSKNEGLPIVVLEAMACGTPVVITEQANLPEVGSYHAGRIVPGDPSSAASAIDSLLDRPEELSYMSQRAKRLVAERFSQTVVLPKLISLYESIAATRQSQHNKRTSAGLNGKDDPPA